MKSARWNWIGNGGLALVVTLAAGSSTRGDIYHPGVPSGGLNSQSQITNLTRTATNATLGWYGPVGFYQVQMTPSLDLVSWSNIASLTVCTYGNSLTLSNLPADQAFFRLSMPPNGYVGSGACGGCHGDKFDAWWRTGHSTAYDLIAAVPPSVRQSCVACHTVGYNEPGGFLDITTTPHLADVGCENCHGPGAAHKYGEHDLVHPIVTLASEVCGGCHTDSHHPTYDEWTNSIHATMDGHVASYFLDPNPLIGQQRQMSCGPCHSAATRVAMLNDYRARLTLTNVVQGVTNITYGTTNFLTLPSAGDAATFPQTCATCHDPHGNYNTAQLRNPLFSTNFFTLPTSYVQTNVSYTNFAGVVTTATNFLNTVFATNYNPNIQICGQCHNTRGADWNSPGRPPHHSPQYNIFIGAVQKGYLNSTDPMPGIFGLNTNGCAQCHVCKITPPGTISDANPMITGHTFEPVLQGMVDAGWYATTNDARADISAIQLNTTNRITDLVALLRQWASSKAPASLTNYGPYAWEYTTAGELSNPTGTNTWITPYGTNAVVSGPSGSQSAVPTTVKWARYNLYLVFHDYSLGVHNTNYVRYLLDNAKSNINWQLSQ